MNKKYRIFLNTKETKLFKDEILFGIVIIFVFKNLSQPEVEKKKKENLRHGRNIDSLYRYYSIFMIKKVNIRVETRKKNKM